MKRGLAIALAIFTTALLGVQRSAAQTAVEGIPRIGAPPAVGVPSVDTSAPASETSGGKDQTETVTVPESEMGDSDSDASDSGAVHSAARPEPDQGGTNRDDWTQVR